MSLLVGDETGLVKTVNKDKAQPKIASDSLVQERRRGVRRLKLNRGNSSLLHCAVASGELETYERDLEDDTWELVGSSPGLEDCAGLDTVEATGHVVSVGAADGRVSFSSFDGGSVGDIGDFETGGNVKAFDCDGSRCVVGGKENEVGLWCLETQAKLFRARNVPHDNLNLRVPVWVGALRLAEENTIIAGTMHHQLRVYDIRVANRRPTRELQMEQAVKSLAVLEVGKGSILVGDVAGGVISVDSRTMRVNARYRGPSGSVRALEVHPTNPRLFAAAGLDRFVHIWDASAPTKNALASVYCKQRLTSLAWLPDAEDDVVGDLEDDDDDDDEDDDEMPDHYDDDRKRKR